MTRAKLASGLARRHNDLSGAIKGSGQMRASIGGEQKRRFHRPRAEESAGVWCRLSDCECTLTLFRVDFNPEWLEVLNSAGARRVNGQVILLLSPQARL